MTTSLSQIETDHTAPRIWRNINRDWSFCYDPDETPDLRRARIDHDTADFHAVAVPHTWHTYETTGAKHPFIRDPDESDNPYWWQGWGWYRKVVRIGRCHSNRHVFLEFDGVQKFCRVYCNNQLMAEHHGGFNSFSVDITEAVRWDNENIIAIAVSARPDDDFGGIPPMSAGNWVLYGGIYRDVRLVLKNGVHIPFQGAADYDGGTFITTPEVDHDHAIVEITTHVMNEENTERNIMVRQRIQDADKTTVSEFTEEFSLPAKEAVTVSQSSPKILSPNLWSPESPYLYSVETTIMDKDEILDQTASPLGFRWFHWNKEEGKLYLNDEPVRITGMNRHQEYPWLGDAVPKFIHKMDLEDMRYNLGVNFARWCHYTQDKFVYDWCDRHGILVCEEVPCIKDLPFGAEVQRQQVVEMIRRDRNHPCIIMWSMGNETNNAADGRWAREEDPTRLIHYRKVQGEIPEADHTHDDLDMENLLRCTVRGWWPQAAMDENTVPVPENHENGQITGTEAWQHEGARIRNVNTRARIDDDTVAWLYADHGADREYRYCPLKQVNPKGWVDAYRQPKLIYWLWQANRTHELMIHIHEYWWRPQQIGNRRNIVVDSNAEVVDLYVDDKHLGTRYPAADNFFSVIFKDVLVENGELHAIARRGKEEEAHHLPMAGTATELRLRSSHQSLTADRASIALITADVIDANGIAVIGARPTLHWEVNGPGSLAAPRDYESDIDKREDSEGTMYTVTPVVMPIRAQAEEGVIEVTVSAAELKPATITIETQAPANSSADGIEEPALGGMKEGLHRLKQQQIDAEHAVSEQDSGEPLLYADLIFDSTERQKIQRRLWRELGNFPSMQRSNRRACKLIETLTNLAIADNGTLIADDVNFHLRQFYQQ